MRDRSRLTGPAEMAAWPSRDAHPFEGDPRDRRHFIATTTAALLALSAGVGAAQGIYATRKAGSVNEKSLEAQERESVRETAARKAEYDQAIALDKQRWADYVRVHEPYWQTGQRAFASLSDIAGYGGPSPQMPSGSAPPAPGVTPGPVARAPMVTAGARPRREAGGPGQRIVTGPAVAMPRAAGGMSLQDLMALASTPTSRGYGRQRYPGPVEG